MNINNFLLLLASLTFPFGCNSQTGKEHQKDPLPPAWQKMAKQGIDFLAIGNEPNWFLQIDFEHDMMLRILARDTATFPVPYPIWNKSAVILNQRSGDDSLIVKIIPQSCSNKMSGLDFCYTVTAKLNNKKLKGCGAYLNSNTKPNLKQTNE